MQAFSSVTIRDEVRDLLQANKERTGLSMAEQITRAVRAWLPTQPVMQEPTPEPPKAA